MLWKVDVIQLDLGVFMSSLGGKQCSKCSEANQSDQQFRAEERIDICNSQRLREEDNARINKGSAMRPRLPKIIEKVCLSRDLDSPETDSHIEVNRCSVGYTDTLSSKEVH